MPKLKDEITDDLSMVEVDAAPHFGAGAQRRILAIAAGALVAVLGVGFLVTQVLSEDAPPDAAPAPAEDPAEPAPAAPEAAAPVDTEPAFLGQGTDGTLAITVFSVECTPKGSDNEGNVIEEFGQQCNLKVSVENRGTETVTLRASQQFLYDAEGFTHTSIGASGRLEFPIEPGTTANGRWFWEPLPIGVSIRALEVHAWEGSPGILVDLTVD